MISPASTAETELRRASTQPIFVERSLYSDAGGITWAAGTNATATRVS